MSTSKATAKIIYQGKNISRDLQPLLIGLVYTDKTEGEADELEIILRNDDLRWFDTWAIEYGDKIEASIVDENNVELNCGTFEVDETTGDGGTSSGDTFTIKAIATGVNAQLRTKRTVAHEKKTLSEIANKIASRHGYNVIGEIEDLKINYIAQVRETDLAFLHRISMTYGYVFSVRDKKLIFTKHTTLHSRGSAFKLERKNDTVYSIKEKITKIYGKARVRHRNSQKGELISKEVTGNTTGKDVLEIHTHVDDEKQAEVIAQSNLYKNNLQQIEMTFSGLPGNVLLVSGNNVDHAGFGKYDGKYSIKESTHYLDKNGGYSTDYSSNKI